MRTDLATRARELVFLLQPKDTLAKLFEHLPHPVAMAVRLGMVRQATRALIKTKRLNH